MADMAVRLLLYEIEVSIESLSLDHEHASSGTVSESGHIQLRALERCKMTHMKG